LAVFKVSSYIFASLEFKQYNVLKLIYLVMSIYQYIAGTKGYKSWQLTYVKGNKNAKECSLIVK